MERCGHSLSRLLIVAALGVGLALVFLIAEGHFAFRFVCRILGQRGGDTICDAETITEADLQRIFQFDKTNYFTYEGTENSWIYLCQHTSGSEWWYRIREDAIYVPLPAPPGPGVSTKLTSAIFDRTRMKNGRP